MRAVRAILRKPARPNERQKPWARPRSRSVFRLEPQRELRPRLGSSDPIVAPSLFQAESRTQSREAGSRFADVPRTAVIVLKDQTDLVGKGREARRAHMPNLSPRHFRSAQAARVQALVRNVDIGGLHQRACTAAVGKRLFRTNSSPMRSLDSRLLRPRRRR
jgi:hypothetical protein